jgi:hypothetical protein
MYPYANGDVELRCLDKSPTNLTSYHRVGGNISVNTITGEAIECRESINRADNLESVRRSMRYLQLLIAMNFVGNHTELHITLTFAIAMFVLREVKSEARKFIARLREKFALFEYVQITEPRSDGSWHIHLLLKRMGVTKLFIEKTELEHIWGLGHVWVKRLEPSVVSGYYFTKPEKQELFHFYPAHSRIFTCSRGIRKVEPLKMPYADAKMLLEEYVLISSVTTHVMRDNEDGSKPELNAITYEKYRPG